MEDRVHGPGMSHPEMHLRTRRGGGRLRPIHFKEESISLCHPERSEGSLSGERSFAALRMTLLPRLRLTRRTSSLKWIDHKGSPLAFDAGVSQIKNCL